MDLDEKRKKQREATKRWRERNPEKVIAANNKKRVRVYEPEKRKAWRESRIQRDAEYLATVNAQARKRKDDINSFLRKRKLQAGCLDCGYVSHHAALEFHHVGEKDVNLSFAKSLGVAKSEMEKCVVLCSNCHRIRHWNEQHPCKPDIFELTYEAAE
jgi:hypothetical protein